MNIDKIVAVGIRLFAISLFLEFIAQTQFLWNFQNDNYTSEMSISTVQMFLTTFLPLLTSLFLWFFPLTLAKKIIKPEINHDVTKVEFNQFFPALIIFLGLYILTYAIPNSIYLLNKWNFMSQNSHLLNFGIKLVEENEFKLSETRGFIITTAFEIIIGLFFIFKARYFSSQLLRVAK